MVTWCPQPGQLTQPPPHIQNSSFSFLLFFFLQVRTVGIHPLGKFHVYNFSAFLHAGFILSLLLWCWKLIVLISAFTTWPYHPEQESTFLFPPSSIRIRLCVPGVGSWPWTITLGDTNGICLMIGLTCRLPVHPSTCHIDKYAFSWWPQADQNPRLHMRVESTNQNPHGGHERVTRWTGS